MNICFYFQVHQPFRIRPYSIFDIGTKNDYFDEKKNKEVCLKVAKKCYLPMNALLLELINKHMGTFKVAFSISGTAIEQFEKYAPEVLESFKKLVDTGCVELLSETYYHSLSYLYDKDEFRRQVKMHTEKMQEHFDYTPTVFRNTELIYYNELAMTVEQMGYKGILAEGVDRILGPRSANFVYKPVGCDKIKLLLKNYKLSDDIAFRFSNKGWEEWPLSVKKYESWIGVSKGETINLFMDYETFGEHQWEDTGIFKFMKQLPDSLLEHHSFVTPSELCRLEAKDTVDIHHPISWADIERDLSAWLGNSMQHDAINQLYQLKEEIKQTNDPKLMNVWRKLTTSDHFYYMCVKWFADGDVHKYFNPYDSPYEGFISFMNVLKDIKIRVKPTLIGGK
jgi:alpha-amylase